MTDLPKVVEATAALTFLGFLASPSLSAQLTPIDINRTPIANESSDPEFLTTIGSRTFFVADTHFTGRELHVTSGTAASTRLVVDLSPGRVGTEIREVAAFQGMLYFVVRGPVTPGIWRSDGTAAGTRLFLPASSSLPPMHLTVSGSTMFFSAVDASGRELWKTDGTVTGTGMVTDLSPGGSSAPESLTPYKSGILFSANVPGTGRELWFSDGSVSGTVLVKDLVPGPDSGTPKNFGAFGGDVYFGARHPRVVGELWRTDGTTAGTVPIKKIPVVGESAAFGGHLYFRATTTAGSSLMRTDGTTAGTVVFQSFPSSFYLTVFGGRLWFTGGPGSELRLWSTDGTAAGTVAMPISARRVQRLRVVGGLMFFLAEVSPTELELWRSDGSATGTYAVGQRVPNPKPNEGSTMAPAPAGRGLLLRGQDNTGVELWISNGSGPGTRRLVDLNRPPANATADSWPADLTTIHGITYFSADDGVTGRELWRSDGSVAGTYRLTDIKPGPGDSNPSNIRSVGSKIYFTATDAAHGAELWTTDGTNVGTRLVRDIEPGPTGSNPYDFVEFRGLAYFSAGSGSRGRQLWSSDGTASGTRQVASIAGGSGPQFLTVHRERLYFSFYTTATGRELWSSDGSAAGTQLLVDLAPGASTWFEGPKGFAGLGDMLLFFAQGPQARGLYRTDGTATGTVLLRDYPRGHLATFLSDPVVADGFVLFRATDARGVTRLWRCDGTLAGTRLVLGPSGSSPEFPASIHRMGATFVFTAVGPAPSRWELWRTDGSNAGTVRVTSWGSPRGPSGKLVGMSSRYSWFTTFPSGPTTEGLYVTDGTAAGTRAVSMALRGVYSLTPNGDQLLFRADDAVIGKELFVARTGAASEPFGRGWGENLRDMRIRASDPILGGTMTISGDNANGLPLAMTLVSVPPRFPTVVGFGRHLYVDFSNAFRLGGAVFTNRTAWTQRVPIPNLPTLAGEAVTIQAVQWPAQALFGLEGSNGLRLTLGR